MVHAATRELTKRLFDALDWGVLGDVYCDEGGDAFWAEHRRPTLVAGLAWADALGRRVGRSGTSLYVGAGVAELPAIVFEVRELGRRVVAANLREAECEVVRAALHVVGLDAVDVHAGDALDRVGDGPFDHVGLVSALTDPETWPVTSAVTYGRVPPVLLDVDAFVAERARIAAVVDRLLAALSTPAVVTTTVEEVPWLLRAAELRGLEVDADDEVIDSAVVGDPIGFLTLR